MRSRFCESQSSGTHGYGYSNRNSKFSKSIANFFLSQNVQHMRKPLIVLNELCILKNIRDMHIEKTVLKTTNKTPAVIAQSTERWTLDRKSRILGSLCKRALWAPSKIRCGCNVRHVPVKITPCKFWGYIKSRVYICNPQTFSEIKDSINREIANIPHTMLLSALLSSISCMQCVIACDNTHVENV